MSSFFFITLAFSPFILARAALWLSILQQKEYRADRLLEFLKTEDGKISLLKVLPHQFSFTRTGLKRPHHTKKLLAIAFVLGVILLLSCFIISTTHSLFVQLFLVTSMYFFIPVFVATAAFPFSILTKIYTKQVLKQAKQKIRKHTPLIIGITGSYGKTTTKTLLSALLSQKYSVYAPPKSHNTPLAVAMDILTSYKGQKIVILEYAAYKLGEIEFLTSFFKPQIAVITGFSPQHIGLFGSQENIKYEKSRLIASIPPHGKVYTNDYDPRTIEIVKIALQPEHVLHECKDTTKCPLKKAALDEDGKLSFILEKKKVHTKFVGKQYLANIHVALCVAKDLEVPIEKMIEALEKVQPPETAISAKRKEKNILILNDGKNVNPKGFFAALDLVQSIPSENRILITGGIIDLGEFSAPIHLEIAERARHIFHTVLYTGVEGREQFVKIFGSNCITKHKDILSMLQQIPSNSCILIEGHLQPHYASHLQ